MCDGVCAHFDFSDIGYAALTHHSPVLLRFLASCFKWQFEAGGGAS